MSTATDTRLAGVLRRAADAVDTAREERDAVIRDAYAAGMSAADIAAAVGVTRGRVHQIVPPRGMVHAADLPPR